jgi:chitodextrinase
VSAAAKRTVLLAVSVVILAAVALAGAAGGASWKRDRTPPTAPTNVHVESAAATWVMLAWTPSQDDVGVAGYVVYKETGQAKSSSSRYMLSGLECGASTTVSVVAVDRAGNQSPRASATVATAACPDLQPPTTPTGFRQAATSQTAVVLSWNPSTDNVGVVGYGVSRGPLLPIASPAEPTVTLSGLVCSSTYAYTVDAVDAAGNRSPLANAYVQTADCTDGQPPSAPAGLAVTARTQTSLSLAWSPSTDDVGVAGYRVYANGSLVYSGPQTTTVISSLACGLTYPVAVEAFDAAGNQSPASTVSAATQGCSTPPPPPSTDTAPPSTPSNQTISGATASSFVMSWSPSADNVAVTGYTVYLNGAALATVTSTSYTYVGLACGTTYTVALEARDAAGNVSNRAEATGPASTLACSAPPPPPTADTVPPSQPSNLSVSNSARTTVSLAWAPSTDNIGVTGYAIYVDGSANSSTSQPGATVSNLVCGTAYTFEVDARDAAGNRSARAAVTASTSACADTQPPTAPANVTTVRTATSIALSWTASSDNMGVTGYGLYRDGTQTGTTTATTEIFSGLTCNTNYSLGVDAFDAAGNRSSKTLVMVMTAACADTQAPSVPQGQRITGTTETTIGMAWNASTDNVGVTGYEIWLDDVKLANTTALTYTYVGLGCGTSHTVGLVAYDAAGNRSDRTLASGPASTSPCSTPPPSPPPPPPPSSGDANLWVDSNGGTCTRSSGAPYVDAQACSSFDAAWDAAQSGDTIRVRPGTYGAQNVTGDKSSVTKIIGENGVVIGGGNPAGSCSWEPGQGWMQADGNYMWLENVTIDVGNGHGQGSGGCIDASNVTYQNVNLYGPYVSLYPVGQNFTWRGGKLGRDGTVGGLRSCANMDGQPIWIESSATGTTIDGVTINPQDADPTPTSCQPGNGFHLEDVRIQEAQNVSILNSRFVDSSGVPGNGNGSGNIFITSSSTSTSAASNFRLENTILERVNGSYAIQIHANVQRYNNWVIRGNRFDQPVLDGGTYVNASTCGNTGQVPASWQVGC